VRPAPRVPVGALVGRRHWFRSGRTRAGQRTSVVPEPDDSHVQRGAVDGRVRRARRVVQRVAVRGQAGLRRARDVPSRQQGAVRRVLRLYLRRRGPSVRRSQPPGVADHVWHHDRAPVRRPAERRHEKVHRQLSAVSETALFRPGIRADHVPRANGRVRTHGPRAGRAAVQSGAAAAALRRRRYRRGRRNGRRHDVSGQKSGERASRRRRRRRATAAGHGADRGP